MPHKYVLTYFDIRGLAEMARLLLADNGIPFTEKRIKTNEEWLKIKKQFSFGQIPCLKDDDVPIVQTGAIIRHLARKHNLYGRDEDDQCYADMFFEGIRDLHDKYVQLMYKDYETEGKKEQFLSTTLPLALGQLEKLLVSRQNGEQFVLGDKISFVDYALFEELDVMLILDPTTLDAFPSLKAFHKRINQRPSLKAYLDKRAADCVKVNWNGRQ
uniref:Glutathione S-transferase n=1 Tax=Steinernema glaseri TaxID=37863 RepID=A0A1I7Y067_9BILA